MLPCWDMCNSFQCNYPGQNRNRPNKKEQKHLFAHRFEFTLSRDPFLVEAENNSQCPASLVSCPRQFGLVLFSCIIFKLPVKQLQCMVLSNTTASDCLGGACVDLYVLSVRMLFALVTTQTHKQSGWGF